MIWYESTLRRRSVKKHLHKLNYQTGGKQWKQYSATAIIRNSASQRYLCEIATNDYWDLETLINLSFSCDQVTVITDFSKLEEAGRSHYLTMHGGGVPVEEYNQLNGIGIIRRLIVDGGGRFNVLLVFMLDRLGRREVEDPFVVEWIVRNSIEVWSAVVGKSSIFLTILLLREYNIFSYNVY